MNYERRCKRFVDQNIQGRILVYIAVYWILYHAFVWHALFLAKGILGQPAMTFGERYREFFSEYYLLLVCAVLVFPMVLADMIKLTHRVVGPFASLQRALNGMAHGNVVSRIKLREKDLIGDLAASINNVIDYHNVRLRNEAMELSGSEESNTDSPPMVVGGSQ